MSLKQWAQIEVDVKEGMLSSGIAVAHSGSLSVEWLMDPAPLP